MSDLDLTSLLPAGFGKLKAYSPPEGAGTVRLDANESPFEAHKTVVDQIRQAFEGVSLNRYPDPASSDLREAFARCCGCPAENVMAGTGSDELIGLLIWTLRGPAGKVPVIQTPAPTFAMYSINALAAGYEICEVPLDQDLKPDMEGMLRAVRERKPSILFLSNPNNPTGSWFERDQVAALVDAASGLVVVDEAYGDYSGLDSWINEVPSRSNLAVLRTLSKVGGAAVRCGFLAADRRVLEELNKIRPPFNMSRYAQVAGEVLLRNYGSLQPGIQIIIRERARLSEKLRELGFRVFPSRGNFLLVQCFGAEEAFWRFLQEQGIVIKFIPSQAVTGDALRISVGSGEENDLLIDRAQQFMEKGGADAKR